MMHRGQAESLPTAEAGKRGEWDDLTALRRAANVASLSAPRRV